MVTKFLLVNESRSGDFEDGNIISEYNLENKV
jgi:hypothetical protein